MQKVENVTAKQLEEIIASDTRPVIIDAWAPWCGPCKSIEPYFKQLNEEFGNQMRFVKVNVEDDPTIAQKYMITSLPTFVIIKNGEPYSNLIGANRKKLKQLIEDTLDEN